jgi:hypothetical protein
VSHHALQRVVVRMLYDRAFQEAVRADPEKALAGLDLTPEERSWLAAVDPRAYRADPLRRVRSLKDLLEEYPASAALVAAARGSVQALDAFFSSEAFHGCVQARGSMALAFGAYLERLGSRGAFGDRRVGPMARLETAIAALRRAGPDGARGTDASKALRRSAGAALLELPGGTLELYQRLLGSLAELDPDPVAALLHPRFRLKKTRPLRERERQPVLVLRDAATGGVSLEELPPALYGLLSAAGAGRPRDELLAEARRLGAEPGEDVEILDGLVADGLLVGL